MTPMRGSFCAEGLIPLSLAAVAGFSVLALCVGRYWIPASAVVEALFSSLGLLPVPKDATAVNVVLSLRLPRIAAALLVGSALAVSGATYQAVFRNPLVAPDLLGVSSGACVGASMAIIAGLHAAGVQLCAFVGGIAAVGAAMSIPRRLHHDGMMMLVLAGIIVSGILNSILGLLKYVADPETHLVEITYWQLGSIAKVLPQNLGVVSPVMTMALVVLLSLRWRLNVLSLGDEEARSLGVSVKRLRLLMVVCATLLTSCSVCIGGTIGWIGLVIPHLGRLLVGVDNVKLLPMTAVLGAVFLLVVDTIARSLSGAELPLSILTGLLGASFFLWLLGRRGQSV